MKDAAVDVGQSAKEAAGEVKDVATGVGESTREAAGEIKETSKDAASGVVGTLSGFFRGLSQSISGWAAGITGSAEQDEKK